MSQDIKRMTKKGRSRSLPTWQTYVFLILIFGVHIGLIFLGGYVFTILENTQGNTSETSHTDYHSGNESTPTDYQVLKALEGSGEEMTKNNQGWNEEFTLNKGFMLSFSIATTVGYGDVIPLTVGGKLFTILFALFSIPITFLLVCKIAVLMAYYNELICEAILKKNQYEWSVRALGLFFMTVFGFVLYVLIPSLVLTYAFYEGIWTFVDSLYFVFVTLTTIGFGDFLINVLDAGLWASVILLIWVIAGMSWFAALVTMVMTMFQNRVRRGITDVN